LIYFKNKKKRIQRINTKNKKKGGRKPLQKEGEEPFFREGRLGLETRGKRTLESYVVDAKKGYIELEKRRGEKKCLSEQKGGVPSTYTRGGPPEQEGGTAKTCKDMKRRGEEKKMGETTI